MDFTRRPIAECVRKVSQIAPASNPNDEFLYVDLSSIDKDEKRIVTAAVQRLNWADAPSRARQLVKAGDILVSTVRPNLNGVAQIDVNYDGAIASTGFCVLRTEPDVLDSRYLFHWLCSPKFVAEMVKFSTGASYPAVSDRIIYESLIPLPSDVNEQRRIATILDKVDDIRTKRREVLRLADEFLRSVFLDMFGDLFFETNNEWKKLSDCTDFIDYRGKTPEKSDNGVRLITAKNVRDGVINIEPAEFISEATYSWWMSRGFPQSGDVLFTTEAPLGNVAVLNTQEPVAIGQRLIAIRPREMLRWDYLSWALRQSIVQSDILSRSTGSTVKGIRSAELVQVQIPIPGKVDQLKFEKIVASINHQKSGMQLSAQLGDLLFKSLQYQAFQGSL